MRTLVARSIAALALTFGTVAATAQLAPGSTLVLNGAADATDIGSPGVVLDFSPYAVTGGFTNTGSFSGLNAMSGGAPGALTSVTVGVGTQQIPSFLTIGGYTFNLVSLPSGKYEQADCRVAPVVGQRCTPPQSPGTALSPFYLENVSSGYADAPFTALVAFDLVGTVTDPHGIMSAFTGTISSTFEGLSYQEVLGALEGQGPEGLPDVPFSGTFVAGEVLPEPGTYALVAAGLLGVAGVVRRRRQA